jgi:hypothetical protein
MSECDEIKRLADEIRRKGWQARNDGAQEHLSAGSSLE